MNKLIGDKAVFVFGTQFYFSICFGLSLKKSFNQAKAVLMLEDITEEVSLEHVVIKYFNKYIWQ